MKEVDIYSEVLEKLGYSFVDESRNNYYDCNILHFVQFKKKVRLIFKFETGEVSSVKID